MDVIGFVLVCFVMLCGMILVSASNDKYRDEYIQEHGDIPPEEKIEEMLFNPYYKEK